MVVGDAARVYEVVASGAGRRVETAVRRGVAEVSEVTLRSQPRRQGRCPLRIRGEHHPVMAAGVIASTRVFALVGQPIPREDASERVLGDDPKVR
ncbi:hypothetical protein FHX80_11344 [Streptomyces brevispora]|uniref:Uncharacterized protein n=1 Tax=Streptomyces brevispora TaxID=887462 RepID=A0A561URF7_9ACTN|nr:hypothetical protein [Streptomyces brevispora]TWG01944.1 hypothetical protein FHX80_11344 [Streptomyces brevispora]